MEFFTSPDVKLMVKLLELVYMVIGVICLYAAYKNFKDTTNTSRIGTVVFWGSLGILMAVSRFLPSFVNGILVVAMCVTLITKKLRKGIPNNPTKEETMENFTKIGFKIFLPALSIGLSALVFGLIGWNSLVGTGFGVILAIVMLRIFLPKNKLKVFFDDSERFLAIVGPTCLLPILLSVLGTIFTKAGVGEVISSIVSGFIPEGNLTIGIIVYGIGMALFTMIMGNGFAAITVMTVGIGGPFVLDLGADPVIVGMLALTCGFCGTLMTPMAANFNVLPVAILDMKDNMGVIKNQVIVALIMLAFQIGYMLVFA